MSKDASSLDFDMRIIEHQPLAYLKAVGGSILYSFSPVRGDGPAGYPIWYHQFHTYYPISPDAIATLRIYNTGPHVEPALADFLTAYRRNSYLPAPLPAAGLAPA